MLSKSTQKASGLGNALKRILTNRFSAITIAVLLALAITWGVILVMKADPLRVFGIMINGSVGSVSAATQLLQAWVPLVLATCGLMFTFTAGLWNIGMEGQIEVGAICAYGVIHYITGSSTPGYIVIILASLAGMAGGAFWAYLVGLLKNYGGVNEIFGGLGFNFIADALLLYLVYGPWKPAGVAQGSTKMIDAQYWLPQIQGTYLSIWSLGLAILGILIVTFVLKGTYFGLKLKAVGKNPKASFMMGIPTSRYVLLSFVLCGLFGGLAGSFQVTGFLHVLRNSISGGYGYLALMVGMLANYQPLIGVPISLFFTALSKGATGLVIDLQLDTNFSGVIQGLLVLCVLLMQGVRARLAKGLRGVQHG